MEDNLSLYSAKVASEVKTLREKLGEIDKNIVTNQQETLSALKPFKLRVYP